jgi:hypothetical protein
MTGKGDAWFDEAAGPLVPAYAVTRGRTRTHRELSMITLVVAVRPTGGGLRLDREYVEILDVCRRPLSIAEVSAKLHLPLAVTKILVGDLIEGQYLIFRSPPPATGDIHDLSLLQKVLDGIRRL